MSFIHIVLTYLLRYALFIFCIMLTNSTFIHDSTIELCFVVCEKIHNSTFQFQNFEFELYLSYSPTY